MRARPVAVAAIGLVALPHHIVVASNVQQAHHLSERDNVPNMPYPLDTIKTCNYWYDNNEGLTSMEARDWMNAISPEDFSRWNPSITLDCGNWKELSYCVRVEGQEWKPRTTSSTPQAPSKTSTATPTSTRKPELLGWEPIGCYVEKYTLWNDTTKVDGNQLTVTKCEAACFDDGFLYVGVKAGTDCWCGNFVGTSWTENQADCNIPCPGDPAQVCGGASVFNVFEAKTKNTLPPAYTFTGGGSSRSTTSPTTTTSSTAAANLTTPATTETTLTTASSEATMQLAPRRLTWLGAGVVVIILQVLAVFS